MLTAKSILVPTDFSEHSDKALELALQVAKQNKAKLYILHVIHEAMHQCASDYCLSDELMQQMEGGMMSAAQQGIQKQLSKFPDTKEVEVVPVVRKGFPSDEILKEQQEKKVDLIVIAPLGRTGIARFLIGSVTKNVVREAQCPVLVAK